MSERVATVNKAEELAHWYLRLNGFLILPNFILHPDRPGSQRTDADIIGIRFPYREELSDELIDEPVFASYTRPLLVFAEVKTSNMRLNEAWRDADRRNIHDILRAVGVLRKDCVDEAADALYTRGFYDSDICCSLLFIGDGLDPDLLLSYAAVPHFTWDNVLLFIHRRFATFRSLKRQNEQWDPVGLKLWKLAMLHRSDASEFVQAGRREFYLPSETSG